MSEDLAGLLIKQSADAKHKSMFMKIKTNASILTTQELIDEEKQVEGGENQKK